MSAITELDRINRAKLSIRNAIINKGVPIEDNALIDIYPSKISQIEGGGSGSYSVAGTGWETYSSFPAHVSRIDKLGADLNYTRQKYAEWDPKSTSASRLYENDSMLVYAPKIDISNVTDMSFTFYNCTNLLEVPYFNIENVSNINSVFNGCKNISRFPLLDASNISNANDAFKNCSSLESFPGLHNMKVSFSLKDSPNLSVQSLQNIIYELGDVSNLSAKSELLLSVTSYSKLSSNDMTNAEKKGWNIKQQ